METSGEFDAARDTGTTEGADKTGDVSPSAQASAPSNAVFNRLSGAMGVRSHPAWDTDRTDDGPGTPPDTIDDEFSRVAYRDDVLHPTPGSFHAPVSTEHPSVQLSVVPLEFETNAGDGADEADEG